MSPTDNNARKSPNQALGILENSVADEQHYLKATLEVENNTRDEALWAKSLALAQGNAENAKYKYIKLRVEQLLNSQGSDPSTSGHDNHPGQKEPQLLPSGTETDTNIQGFFQRLAAGDFGLVKTFWLFGILPNVFFYGVLRTIVLAKDYGPKVILIIPIVLFVFFFVPVLCGTWFSATRYTGFWLWATIAKLFVLVGILWLFVVSTTIFIIANA